MKHDPVLVVWINKLKELFIGCHKRTIISKLHVIMETEGSKRITTNKTRIYNAHQQHRHMFNWGLLFLHFVECNVETGNINYANNRTKHFSELMRMSHIRIMSCKGNILLHETIIPIKVRYNRRCNVMLFRICFTACYDLACKWLKYQK